MSSLLKIQVTPQGSLSQKQAAEYVGGLEALRKLESDYGLIPWDKSKTLSRYRVTAIEEAMQKAERNQFLQGRLAEPVDTE